MFSHNKKISLRQMKSMLIMDWLGKLSLLLPVYLAGRSLGSMVGCLAIGLLLWLWFSRLISNASDGKEDFFDTISRLAGRGSAWLVYLVGFFYFLSHAAVCMNLCAYLAGIYLLPAVPVPVLTVFPLLAGLYLAYSGIEVRGRIGELFAPGIVFLFLLMAAAALSGVVLQPGPETLLQADEGLMVGGYEVLACLGGLFLPMLGNLAAEEKGDTEGQPSGKDCFGAVIRRAACWSLIPAGILLFLTAASFGTEGMRAFQFPGVRVMSSLVVPGGFVQRWDVFFLMLMLVSLAMSVGSGFWYLNQITERLWREGMQLGADAPGQPETAGPAAVGTWIQFRGLAVIQGIAAFATFCAASGFESAEIAVCYYRAFNLYLLTPAMLLVYLILYFRKKQRAAKRARVLKAASLMLLFCLLLTGCTARELEDRIFPMALELQLEGEEIVMTYAWNGSGKAENKDEENKSGTDSAEPKNQGNLTVFRGFGLSDIWQQVEEYSDRYIDYSHVKALILDEKISGNPKLEQEFYEWLAGEPAFAASLIIYPREKSGITLEDAEQRSEGEIGTYFENLYQNNQKYRETAATLGEVTRAYYAGDSGAVQ